MELRISSTEFLPVSIVLAIGFAIALGLAASSGVAAEAKCFSGDQDTGELRFSGAVEGTDFTGRFGAFSVRYCIPDSGPADGQIDVRVQLSSADTENRERDETLKGEEFFAVEKYPDASWTSLTISEEAGRYAGVGELVLKGIKAEQAITFTLTPEGDDLLAQGEFRMRGGAEVERLRFDVGTGDFADPEFVRNRVDVDFEIRLRPQD